MENTIGNTKQTVFGNIPLFALPEGTYHLFMAVTPAGAGNLNICYLWWTYFDVPH
jgi:hypothetical protein